MVVVRIAADGILLVDTDLGKHKAEEVEVHRATVVQDTPFEVEEIGRQQLPEAAVVVVMVKLFPSQPSLHRVL